MKQYRPHLVAVTAAGTGLAAGLALGVTGLASASTPTGSTNPAASAAGAQPRDHGRHHEGRRGGGDLVTAVTGGTITLDTPRGVKTVTVNSQTVYKHGAAAASLSDVKVNEIVRVQFVTRNAATPVAKLVRIEMAHVEGYVTAVSPSSAGTGSITVIDRSGFTRTIQTSAATTYRKAGKAGTAADITVGTFVHAEGNVDANGTTLDATRVQTGQPPRKDRTGAKATKTNDRNP